MILAPVASNPVSRALRSIESRDPHHALPRRRHEIAAKQVQAHLDPLRPPVKKQEPRAELEESITAAWRRNEGVLDGLLFSQEAIELRKSQLPSAAHSLKIDGGI